MFLSRRSRSRLGARSSAAVAAARAPSMRSASYDALQELLVWIAVGRQRLRTSPIVGEITLDRVPLFVHPGRPDEQEPSTRCARRPDDDRRAGKPDAPRRYVDPLREPDPRHTLTEMAQGVVLVTGGKSRARLRGMPPACRTRHAGLGWQPRSRARGGRRRA